MWGNLSDMASAAKAAAAELGWEVRPDGEYWRRVDITREAHRLESPSRLLDLRLQAGAPAELGHGDRAQDVVPSEKFLALIFPNYLKEQKNHRPRSS